MRIFVIIIFLGIFKDGFCQSSEIGTGSQPHLSLDASGTIRLIYGQENRIFYSVSSDGGNSFSNPAIIAEVGEMHLGMGRGPQLASSRDYSVVTAINKKGNIFAYQLNHKTKKWNPIANVNDVEGSAPEGLMSIAADDANRFYTVWLDLRDDKNNKIAFSTLAKNGSWSKNKIIYRSPDKTVCECCKPSVAVRDKNVSVMFRNWLDGSRDLYLVTSSDGGSQFSSSAKLGNGTWKLKGCPMDGGGILIDKGGVTHSVWQREGVVYYDTPGHEEVKVSEGRGCNLFGGETPFMTWQEGAQISGQLINGKKLNVAEGTAATVVQLNDKTLIAAWESGKKIFFRRL